MKKQMLKIAGVKSEKEFYKKFPDEASFMAKHGKEFKKAMRGSKIDKAQVGDEILQLSGEVRPTIEYTPSNVPMYNPYAQPRPTVKTAPLPKTQLGNVKDMGAKPAISSTPTATKAPTDIAPYLQAGVDVVEGLSMIRDQRDAVRSAKQQSELGKIYEMGVASVPAQQPRRQYVTPYDVEMQPEQMFPSYGVGTNVLAQDGAMIGGNPTEIQNTFAPNTIYTDLGYQPLNDPSKMKQYEMGGELPIAANGFDFNTFMTRGGGYQMAGDIGQIAQGDTPEAGNKIGRGIGTAAGTAIGGPIGGAIGGLVGSIAGGAIDQSEEKIKRYQDLTTRSMGNVMGSQLGANLRTGIFGSNMQDGGTTSPYKWVSHTWQPQVIASFGEHKMKDLLKPPADADMLRAGGHLKAYTPPSARAMSTERPMMQMGGELETHWGGYAEPMSYNPYLPGEGETVMFRGQSHDESDGKGNTGIGITFGENPVEVERGEPALKLKDGDTGEENLTVFGNIKITNAFADMLADPKAKGKKFKSYVADLSKQENKLNGKIDKATNEINELDVFSSFDKMKMNTLDAVVKGSNQKLKDIADKKENAAALQNAINDSKEEGLLNVTDDGRVLAKKGAEIPKAQRGKSVKGRANLRNVDPKILDLLDLLSQKGYNVYATSGVRPGSQTAGGRESRHSAGQAMDVVFPDLGAGAYDAILKDPEVASYLLQNDITAINEYDPAVQEKTGATGPHIHFGYDKGTPLSDDFRKRATSLYPTITPGGGLDRNFQNVSDITNYYKQFGYKGGENINELQKWIIDEARKNPAVANELTSYLRSVPLTNKGKRMYGPGAAPTSLDADRLFEQFNDGLWDYRFPKLNSIGVTKAVEEGLKTVELGKKEEQKKPSSTTFAIPPVQTSPVPAALRELVPMLTRRRFQPLDPNQLAGEMFALTNNQVEPVYAQKLIPELSTPYDISLQDILNQNQADYNSTQRLTGYNPEALSMLNAQKYQANQKVLGEQFRMNQAKRDSVYKENRDILNQSKLVNLQILERQADKQAKALSNTKATTQEALNSISAKYAQNLNRQKQYAAMENLFNFRFTPGMRTINVNPAPTFNLPNVPGLTATYDANGNLVYTDIGNPEAINPLTPTTQSSTGGRRGKMGVNIAKAIKNL
jgi:hypothetical protein